MSSSILPLDIAYFSPCVLINVFSAYRKLKMKTCEWKTSTPNRFLFYISIPTFIPSRTSGLKFDCAVDIICVCWFLKLQEVTTCCYRLVQPTCRVACCSFKDEAVEDILPHCSNATLLISFSREIVWKTLQGRCRTDAGNEIVYFPTKTAQGPRHQTSFIPVVDLCRPSTLSLCAL